MVPRPQAGRGPLEEPGFAYAYKDVDDDANAQELAAEVKAAGEKQGAIPVTDVEGDLLVGWSQQRFDEVFDAKAK